MCSLIVRKIAIVKSVRRQKTRRAGCRTKLKNRVDGIALSTTFGDLITADHKNSERKVKTWTQKRSNRAI